MASNYAVARPRDDQSLPIEQAFIRRTGGMKPPAVDRGDKPNHNFVMNTSQHFHQDHHHVHHLGVNLLGFPR